MTFLDSFNTGKIAGHFAKERFGEGPQRPCLAEVGQPWLYGKHPGEGIAWVIGAGKVALFSGLAYRMKLHHNRFWVFPEAGMLMATPDVVTGIKNCD